MEMTEAVAAEPGSAPKPVWAAALADGPASSSPGWTDWSSLSLATDTARDSQTQSGHLWTPGHVQSTTKGVLRSSDSCVILVALNPFV